MPDPFNTGVASPQPPPAVCARCGGAIEPGLARCPTCGAPQSRPRGSTGVVGTLVGSLAGLLGLALAAGWIWPELFRHLHLGPVARWLEASNGHRLLAMLGIWVAFILGHGTARLRARDATGKAWAPFAAASGGQVVSGPATVAAGERRDGLEVRTHARRWLLTLDTTRDHSSEATRMRCSVAPRRDFHFALLPQHALLRAVTSPRVGGFLLALGRSAGGGGPGDDAARRALDEMSFIVGAPIQLGEPEFDRAFLIKSDDEAAVRALLGDLRGELLGLRRTDGAWQMTLAASLARGSGELEYREPGIVRDAARLEAVRQTMTHVLEHLAAAGIVTEAGPASNA